MRQVKYRAITDGDVCGERGSKFPAGAAPRLRKDGSMEQAWHCLPFSEAARYGFELLYPYDHEMRVGAQNGRLAFDGDFGPPPEGHAGDWPPFRDFGQRYYTYQLSLDLKVDEGYAVRTEPHPRFYTDYGFDADRRSGAHPALVANDLFPGVQVAARGRRPRLSARRSDRADHRRPGRSGFRLAPMPDARPPNENCSRGASIRAARHWRPIRAGSRRRTRFSTEPTAVFWAPQRARQNRPADDLPVLEGEGDG